MKSKFRWSIFVQHIDLVFSNLSSVVGCRGFNHSIGFMRRRSAKGSCLSGLYLVALTFKGAIRMTRLMRHEPRSFEPALLSIIQYISFEWYDSSSYTADAILAVRR